MTSNLDFATVLIRWAVRLDLPRVVWIDHESYPEDSWTDQDFARYLRQRNCIGLVAEVGHEVVGYVLYELHDDHIDVVRLAVAPEWRRKRVGAEMLIRLGRKLSTYNRHTLRIDVAEENLPAQLWLRWAGVRATAILPDGGGYRFELSA